MGEETDEMQKAQAEHNVCCTKGLIKKDDACKKLIAFTEKTPDPFDPDFSGENAWVGGKGGGGGGCAIL